MALGPLGKLLNCPLRNASGNIYSSIEGASALPPAAHAMRGGGLDDLKEREDGDDFEDIEAAKKSASAAGGGGFMGGAMTKSSSTSNLAPVKSIAKKFSFGKIGRRISDLHVSTAHIATPYTFWISGTAQIFYVVAYCFLNKKEARI